MVCHPTTNPADDVCAPWLVMGAAQDGGGGQAQTQPDTRGQEAQGRRFARTERYSCGSRRPHAAQQGQFLAPLRHQDADDVEDHQRADEEGDPQDDVEDRGELRCARAADGGDPGREGLPGDDEVVRPDRRGDASGPASAPTGPGPSDVRITLYDAGAPSSCCAVATVKPTRVDPSTSDDRPRGDGPHHPEAPGGLRGGHPHRLAQMPPLPDREGVRVDHDLGRRRGQPPGVERERAEVQAPAPPRSPWPSTSCRRSACRRPRPVGRTRRPRPGTGPRRARRAHRGQHALRHGDEPRQAGQVGRGAVTLHRPPRRGRRPARRWPRRTGGRCR